MTRATGVYRELSALYFVPVALHAKKIMTLKVKNAQT